MQTKILEQKLTALFEASMGHLKYKVKLGDTARTFEQWNKAGFRVSKGETSVKIKVGDSLRFYFFRSQVWNVDRYKTWKNNQTQVQKNNTWDLEPSGVM